MKETKLIDRAVIYVKGGKGGNGCMSFRREKYVPKGGPDGGDGGDGGSVFFVATKKVNTLLEYKFKQHLNAENGESGKGSNLYGKTGEDMILQVPVGTIIKDADCEEIVADLKHENDIVCVARGGKGGRGNPHFMTSSLRAPRICERGIPGEERKLLLELKILADVALIGYPSVGKSTLISVISNAKPKIAEYHFTTLSPNLGVVKYGNNNAFMVADIPGLIEGAHEGAGLGFFFLRHIERAHIIAHLIDVSLLERNDPMEDYKKIRNELEQYSKKLSEKEEIIVLNKVDASIPEIVEDTREKFRKMGKEVFPISAVTGEGVKALIDKMYEKISKYRDSEKDEDEKTFIFSKPKVTPVGERLPESIRLEIYNPEEGVFVVGGPEFDALVHRLTLQHYDSYMRFMAILEKSKMNRMLRRAGIKDGDTVVLNGNEFEFIDENQNDVVKKGEFDEQSDDTNEDEPA